MAERVKSSLKQLLVVFQCSVLIQNVSSVYLLGVPFSPADQWLIVSHFPNIHEIIFKMTFNNIATFNHEQCYRAIGRVKGVSISLFLDE